MGSNFTISAIIRAVDKFSGPAQRIARSSQRMGRAMTAGITLPAAFAARSLIETNLRFTEAMNNVRAKSGATGDQFSALKAEALALGRTTTFTASQVGAAMGFLAQAGFRANEILASTAPLLNLARAGMLDLAEAADIATNIGGAFHIDKSLAGTTAIVDALSQVAASSNVNIQQLGETMAYVGPVAQAAGASLQQTAAMAGMLGNIGIQASMAGTGMRRMFLNMTNPSAKAQAALNRFGIRIGEVGEGGVRDLRDMPDILTDIGKAMARLGEQDRIKFAAAIFGDRAVAAGISLAQAAASGQLDAYLAEVKEKSPDAGERMAEIMNQGLVGSLARLKSTFEGLELSIGEAGANNFIGGVANSLSDIFESAALVNPQLVWMATQFVGLAAAVGPSLLMFSLFMKLSGGMIGIFGPIGRGIMTATRALIAFRTAMFAFLFTNPVGWALLAVAAAIGVLVYAVGGLDNALNRVNHFFSGFADAFSSNIDMTPFLELKEAFSEIGELIDDIFGGDNEKKSKDGGAFDLGQLIGKGVAEAINRLLAFVSIFAELINVFLDVVRIFRGEEGAFTDLISTLGRLFNALMVFTGVNALLELTTGFKDFGAVIDWVIEKVQYLLGIMGGQVLRAFPGFGDAIDSAMETLGFGANVSVDGQPASPVITQDAIGMQKPSDLLASIETSETVSKTEALIKVDFANLPRGATVNTDISGTGTDLEVSRGNISGSIL